MMKGKIAVLFVGLLVAASTVQAKLMEPEGLILKLLGHYQQLSQFQVTLKVRVYDPEALVSLDQPLPPQSPASEQTSLGYTQQVLVVRDELLFNQTRDLKGDLLHLSIRSSGWQLEKSYNQKRPFTGRDVQFLPQNWTTKFPSIFKDRLAQLGINPKRVGTTPQGYKTLYRLGGPNNHLLIDPKTYDVLGYQTQVELNGRFYPMLVKFQGHAAKKRELPTKIDYYINGRLFKEARVTQVVTWGMSRKVKALKKQYKNLIKQYENQLDDGLSVGP